MKINNNLSALQGLNSLTQTQRQQNSVMEKLSSGLRINSSADDAAGMAIAQKMNSQVKGFQQANRNSMDAISLIQTAEGALEEVHNMLQRVRELAIQAANDTNTDEDKEQIQAEVNQLLAEVNKIGNTTEFNKKSLLQGGDVIDESGFSIEQTVVGDDNLALRVTNVIDITPATVNPGEQFTINGYTFTFYDSTSGDFTGDGIGIDTTENFISQISALSGSATVGYATLTTTGNNTDGYSITVSEKQRTYAEYEITFGDNDPVVGSGFTIDGVVFEYYDINDGPYTGSGVGVNISDLDSNSVEAQVLQYAETTGFDNFDITGDGNGTMTLTAKEEGAIGNYLPGSNGGTVNMQMLFHVGANANQYLLVDIPEVSAYALGLVAMPGTPGYSDVANVEDEIGDDIIYAGLDLIDQDNAQYTILAIDEALDKVSAIRAGLGAYQNRLPVRAVGSLFCCQSFHVSVLRLPEAE
ncbi:MAG: hypothetical protein ATN36_05155 [Epulopiscium sp. Nele67-Bin005]|nr:MAG: hypothetical protein ATN36_05155 [Epulopiscium sp. Nele67-Bin005]